MLSVLHSLCNFVRGAGADSQAGPWSADGLVMTAVYGKRLLSDDPVQKASRKDGNPVGGKVGRIGLTVADTAFGTVGGKILPQCSAKTDIDYLRAPADTEYRLLNPEKGVQERKLRLIADRETKPQPVRVSSPKREGCGSGPPVRRSPSSRSAKGTASEASDRKGSRTGSPPAFFYCVHIKAAQGQAAVVSLPRGEADKGKSALRALISETGCKKVIHDKITLPDA